MAGFHPFRTFQKHRRFWLASIGIMTMISFIFLGILLQLFDGSGGGGQQVEVFGKSRRFGTIDDQTIYVLSENRKSLAGFYQVLYDHLAVPPNAGTPDESRMAALGFLGQLANSYAQRANPRQLADNWLLAQYAASQGIQIVQADVVAFLTQLCGGYLNDAIFLEVLQSVGMNEKRLEYLIAQELLAARMRQSFEISVSGITPATQWNWFQRMNRQVTAEVAAVPVDAFVGKVGEPTEAQLQALFDRNKDKPWNPTAADSGFAMPNRVALQYVRAVPSQAMLDAVSEADIAKYYDDNKETQFLKPVRPIGERPTLPGLPGQGGMFTPNLGGFTQPLGGARPTVGLQPGISGGLTLPTPVLPDAEPQVPAPVEEPNAGGTQEEAKPADAPVDTSMNGWHNIQTRLVSYQTETEVVPAAEPADETTAGEERSALAEDAEQKPVEESKTEEVQSEEPQTETVKVEEIKVDEPVVAAPEPQAEELKIEEPKTESLPEIPALPETPIDLSILYRPLDEVKEEIRQTLARERAMQALAKVEEKMREYFDAYNRAVDQSKAAPAMPDLKTVAAEQGLELQVIELDTIYGAIKSDFARGSIERERLFQIFEGSPLLFQPESFTGSESNVLYWVTEAISDLKPANLDEVREHVVRRWKEMEAQAPAMKYAEELAAEAGAAGKSLQEALAGKNDVTVVETEPFFWKTYGPGVSPWMAIFNGIPPMIGEVCEKGVAAGDAEIDNKAIFAPGNEFMEKAYSLQVGGIGHVFNTPKTLAYVIRITASTPSDEVLWERFQTASPMEYRMAGQLEMHEEAREAWMKTIYEEIGFEWIKYP